MKPSEEVYVQQFRQMAARGVEPLRRQTGDPLALDQTNRLLPKISASQHSLARDRKLPGQDQCQEFGVLLPPDHVGCRVKKTIWLSTGRVDYWKCAECCGR